MSLPTLLSSTPTLGQGIGHLPHLPCKAPQLWLSLFPWAHSQALFTTAFASSSNISNYLAIPRMRPGLQQELCCTLMV